MPIHPLAGKPVEPSMLVNIPRLVTAYYAEHPDPAVPEQRVAFGTSGHRGSAFTSAFNEAHILAIRRPSVDIGSSSTSTGHSFWEWTLTPSPNQPSRPRLRCWQGTVSR